jgi:hypothetical protein
MFDSIGEAISETMPNDKACCKITGNPIGRAGQSEMWRDNESAEKRKDFARRE